MVAGVQGEGLAGLGVSDVRDRFQRLLEESQFYAGRGERPGARFVRPAEVCEVYGRLCGQARYEALRFHDSTHVLRRFPERRITRKVEIVRGCAGRGVTVRQVTSRPGLAADADIGLLAWGNRAQVWVREEIPFGLSVLDRRIAVVAAELRVIAEGAVVIRDPVLVAALIAVHQAALRGATRVGAQDPADGPPAHLAAVLQALLSGQPDEHAARRIGLSPRTYNRRTAELLNVLGVTNRFQAGAAAARHGWI